MFQNQQNPGSVPDDHTDPDRTSTSTCSCTRTNMAANQQLQLLVWNITGYLSSVGPRLLRPLHHATF